MERFLISDLCLFNEDRMKEMGYDTFDEMNDAIVRTWNSTVKQDDMVYITGVLGDGDKAQMESVFTRLNGKLCFLGPRKNSKFSAKDLKEMGFYLAGSYNIYFQDLTSNFLVCYDKYDERLADKEEFDIILVNSSNKLEKQIVKGKLMSLEAILWDYSPINSSEVVTIYNSMKDYEKLEETSESRTDVQEESL